MQGSAGFSSGGADAFVGGVVVVHDCVERAAYAWVEVACAVFFDAVGVVYFFEFVVQSVDECFAVVECFACFCGVVGCVACPVFEF